MRRFTRSSLTAKTTTTTTPRQSPRRSNRSLPSKPSPPSPRKRNRNRAISPRQDDSSVPTKPPSLTRESIRRMVVSRVLQLDKGEPLETGGIQRHSQPQTDSSGTVLIDTHTIGKWCLVDGLVHCATASDGILAPLILEHGPPLFYLEYFREQRQQQPQRSCHDTPKGYPSFRSLCRTVAGQQLAGAAAETIWRRLVEVVIGSSNSTANEATNPTESFSTSPLSSSLHSFTPDAVLAVVKTDRKTSSDDNTDTTDKLRIPAGLSKAKCGCILAIAKCYRDGSLSESFLTTGTDEEVRSRLLAIKGLGPWSVDMFLMFRCHRSNILPVGDLALRNGTAALWKVRGSGKKNQLCAKQDAALIERLHAPFAPYRSLSSYYMYKVADACKPSKKKTK